MTVLSPCDDCRDIGSLSTSRVRWILLRLVSEMLLPAFPKVWVLTERRMTAALSKPVHGMVRPTLSDPIDTHSWWEAAKDHSLWKRPVVGVQPEGPLLVFILVSPAARPPSTQRPVLSRQCSGFAMQCFSTWWTGILVKASVAPSE